MIVDALDDNLKNKAPEYSSWRIVDLPPIEIKRPDGSNQQLQFSVTQTTEVTMHHYEVVDGISYDVPSDGKLNILLSVPNESGKAIPLAAASMEIQEDGTPFVSMIQMCKARISVPVPEQDPNSLIKIRAQWDKTEHPYQDLLQGQNKIPWQETLLTTCKALATQNKYSSLRFQSGFHSRYDLLQVIICRWLYNNTILW